MTTRTVYNKFNRGELDPLALARDDVEKINNSAALMTNWMPIRLGPMMFRPGFEHMAELDGQTNNFLVPFVRSATDRAILAFQGKYLEIFTIDENDTVTQVPGDSSTTSFSNGTFASNITGWTDDSGGSATTAWTADKGGCASLVGTRSAEARLYQTLGSTDTGAEHLLRVVVKEAPITLRLGTSGANSSDIFEGKLKPGVHHLNFTPAANVTVTFANSELYRALVGLVDFPAAFKYDFNYSEFDNLSGVTGSKIKDLKWVQSGDIVFFALEGVPQFQVERRGTKSWSIVEYRCDDGPFGLINNTDVTLNPTGLTGNTTLTASRAYFKSTDVGQLFKLVSAGQQRLASVSAADNGTGSIRVTGVGSTRAFTINVSGTFTATATLQRSSDDSSWEDIKTYTTATSETYNDGVDNAIYFYRLHVKTGDYTSGTVGLYLDYPSGFIEGICRITAYSSATSVSVQVLEDFGGSDATRDWYREQWGETQGYPSAVEIYEGRLFFAGLSQLWGSVSDAYDSFDRGIEGDSSSIYRTIGFGPTDRVNWLKRGLGMVMAIVSDEISVRSSSYGETLTDTNTNLRSGNTQGSSPVPPERADSVLYYVHRNTSKLFGMTGLDLETFESEDLTKLNPSICNPGIIRIAVARSPETRVFVVLSDGSMRVFLIDPAEGVTAWSRITTDGDVKDVLVIPGDDEDGVYIAVAHGSTYTLERMASFSESVGGTISKNLDASIKLTSPGTTISLSSSPVLTGESNVTVWADGKLRGGYAVSGGSITVEASWTDVVIGIPYTALYTSNKLTGYVGSRGMSQLNQRRRVVSYGVIGQDIWYDTLTVSGDGTNYEKLPLIENGTSVDTDVLVDDYDEPMITFPGNTDTDARVYLKATGPATIMALTYEIEFADDPSNYAQ